MGSRHLHTHSDFNNFVAKFCQLWRAGITANFHVETHAGMAWCQVRAQLGHWPGHAPPAPAHRPGAQRRQPGPRRRGPAHQRRKARRAADRAAATKAAEDAVREKAAEEATAKEAAEEAAAKKAAEEAAAKKAAEEAVAKRVAEEAAAKRAAEEAAAKKAAEEAAAKKAAEEAAASHGGQVAHGEKMKKGEDAAAAAEKVEDGDKDSTIVLSDEEVEQFVTVKKRTKQKEEKEIQHRDTRCCDVIKTTRGWKCRICDQYYSEGDYKYIREKLGRMMSCRLRPRDK